MTPAQPSFAEEFAEQKRLTREQKKVLIKFILDNITSPYAKHDDLQSLMAQTGLREEKIKNWLMNLRKRIWLPIIKNGSEMSENTLRHRVRDKLADQISESSKGTESCKSQKLLGKRKY